MKLLRTFGVLVCVAGCSNAPARILPPQFDPASVARAIIVQCDKDGDGMISTSEANAIPALVEAWRRIDANKDGKLTKDEITQRLQIWTETNLGAMPAPCQVLLNGQPLADAEVVIEPEGVLTGAIQSARCHTDVRGYGSLKVSEDMPGIQCGLYKVRISKLVSGKEIVPSKYNTETQKGLEVSVRNSWPMDIVPFSLTTD
jgi:hypothetical protein